MTIEATAQKTIQLAGGVLNTTRFRSRTPARPPTAEGRLLLRASVRLRLRTKDFEKIWLWLDEERPLLGKDAWGTISLADGIA
jgi:hypothetical protein